MSQLLLLNDAHSKQVQESTDLLLGQREQHSEQQQPYEPLHRTVVVAGRALGSMMAQLEEYKQHAAVAAEQVCCLASQGTS